MSVAGPYSTDFYEDQESGSLRSAEVVVPLVLSVFPARSVVDFGCGVGGWLRVFAEAGVADYLGLDGDYVPRDLLKIPADRFRAVDLTAVPDLDRRFDLACSLEVAEHLPSEKAENFVRALATAAPVVLFSAAVPHQGGTSHINEQWQSYWAELFARHAYRALDFIRPAIYRNPNVEWWYRQNMLVYCHESRIPAGMTAVTDAYELDRVDPDMIEVLVNPSSGREALQMMGRALAEVRRASLRKLRVTGRP